MRLIQRIVLASILIPALSACIYYANRYMKNDGNITPYPFSYSQSTGENFEIDSPILIIGDQLGIRLHQFKSTLSRKISTNLSKEIKIQTMATENLSLVRIVDQIKKLEKLPLIIIYLGNNNEKFEKLFSNRNIKTILKNFKYYDHDIYRSLMMIFPQASRLIYKPIKKITISNKITQDTSKYSDPAYQLRNVVHFKIYESLMDEFLRYAKKNNAIVIPVTTPINFELPPKKSCYGSISEEGLASYQKVKSLLKKRDFKNAYRQSKELVAFHPYNTDLIYQHAQIAQANNKIAEAKKYYGLSTVYDCGRKHSNAVFNNIIRKKARKYDYSYIDFYELVLDQSFLDSTFLDEIYPQDIYFEKLAGLLAEKIKKLLKL